MANEQLRVFANYFIAAHLAGEIQRLSQSVRQTKSCDDVHEYQAILQRAKPALEVASQSTNEQIKKFTDGFIGPVNTELGAMKQFEAAVCK